MLAFRIIAAIAIVLLLAVLGNFFWSLIMPGAGRVDAVAARRIRQVCGFNSECKVRLGDLFDGNWDTVYEFGYNVSQSEIDQVLGGHIVRAHDLQRVLVFERQGKPIRVQYARGGVEKPLEGEIEFEAEHHREQNWAMYRHDEWVRVNSFRVDPADAGSGTYYVLSSMVNPQ
jgi:hypothetical protein